MVEGKHMTPNELQALFTRPERIQPSVLSVYLDVDQLDPSNRNRQFEKRLKILLAKIRDAIHDAPELEAFRIAAHHIEDFVAAYEPQASGLALYFDAVDRF